MNSLHGASAMSCRLAIENWGSRRRCWSSGRSSPGRQPVGAQIDPLSGGRPDPQADLQSSAGGAPRGARAARVPRGEKHHLHGRRRARGGGQPGQPGRKTGGGQTRCHFHHHHRADDRGQAGHHDDSHRLRRCCRPAAVGLDRQLRLVAEQFDRHYELTPARSPASGSRSSRRSLLGSNASWSWWPRRRVWRRCRSSFSRKRRQSSASSCCVMM